MLKCCRNVSANNSIIENRPGAATNLATETAVRAPADGHTLLAVTATNTVNASLYEKLNFNFVRDIAMVAGILSSPLVLEAHPSVPVKTVPELIAYAKANVGKITLASFGFGTTSHVTGELFKMMSGINMLHVPYRGSAPMVTDLIGGQVQTAFDNLPASIEQIRAGKLRALAVTTGTRSNRCRTFQPWRTSCRASRRARGWPSVRPKTHLRKLSTSSTPRSMRPLPIPRSKRAPLS